MFRSEMEKLDRHIPRHRNVSQLHDQHEHAAFTSIALSRDANQQKNGTNPRGKSTTSQGSQRPLQVHVDFELVRCEGAVRELYINIAHH